MAECRCELSGLQGPSALACRKCGCRMVARSGNRNSMLVCADCGWPVDPRTSSEEARKRWTGALLLMVFGLAGVIFYFLVVVIESRTPQRQPAAIEQPAERP